MLHLRPVPSTLVALASLTACDDLRPLRPLASDLTAPRRATLPDAVPLAPVELSTQAGLDAFEARWSPRPGLGALADFLEGLVTAAEAPASKVLLLQRIAVLRADAAALRGDGLEAVIRAGTRLREAAPEAPDTLFVEGYIPWRFLAPTSGLETAPAPGVAGRAPGSAPGSSGRPLTLTAELVPFAESVRDRWRALLAAAPAWRGPRAMDAVWLAARVAEVEAALAARQVRPSPPVAPMDVPPAPAVAFDPSRLAAAEALARFDASPDGERRGLCASWRPHLPGAATTEGGSPESAALALRCATLAGEAGAAVAALASLLAQEAGQAAPTAGLTPGSEAACALREGLVVRFGEAVVAAESTRLGFGLRCPDEPGAEPDDGPPAAAQPL